MVLAQIWYAYRPSQAPCNDNILPVSRWDPPVIWYCKIIGMYTTGGCQITVHHHLHLSAALLSVDYTI